MSITHDTPVRVSAAMENRRQYQSFKGLTGRVNVFSSSPVGEVATVLFAVQGSVQVLEAHIPVNHLVAVSVPRTAVETAERAIPADMGTEAEKQARAVAFLRGMGYRVTVTGKAPEPATCYLCGGKRVLCPVHNQPVFSRGAINNTGLSDLLITHSTRWGEPGKRRCSLEIEFKKDGKAERKPAQIERAKEGTSAFVWSLAMCLQDLVAFERQMGFEPHPDALTYLQEAA